MSVLPLILHSANLFFYFLFLHVPFKEHDLKTCEPHPQHQGLSLPIDDRASIKVCPCVHYFFFILPCSYLLFIYFGVFLQQKRLRDELKKEYNQFLQEQAQIRKLNRRVLPVTFKVKSKLTKIFFPIYRLPDKEIGLVICAV